MTATETERIMLRIQTTKKMFGIEPSMLSLFRELYSLDENTERNVSFLRKSKKPPRCVHVVYTAGSKRAPAHLPKRSDSDGPPEPACSDADANGDNIRNDTKEKNPAHSDMYSFLMFRRCISVQRIDKTYLSRVS